MRVAQPPTQDGSARQASLCFLLDAGPISGNCLTAEEDVAYRRIEDLRLWPAVKDALSAGSNTHDECQWLRQN
jgi:hypothetical protein